MSREAMKLALEALEFDGFTPEDATHRSYHAKAITALKQALEQPEQKPVAVVSGYYGGKCVVLPTDPARIFNSGTAFYTHPPKREPLTDREIELLDGMIEVQLNHAEQCDRIANRTMAVKQKGWDMERVALLKKLKAAHGIAGEEHGTR